MVLKRPLTSSEARGGFHNQADGRLLGDFRDQSWHKTFFFG
jgi:hypothetical protein